MYFISGYKRKLYGDNTVVIPCSRRGSVICGSRRSLLDNMKIAPAKVENKDFNYLDLFFSGEESHEIVGEVEDLVMKQGTGRIKLSKNLIDHIGAERELFITGCLNHIEIWKPESWDENMKNFSLNDYEKLLGF